MRACWRRWRPRAQAPTGELRIACTVTACHSVLPKLFARCRARYPGIHLQLSTSDAARCMQRLENDEVDLAVVPEPDRPARELRFVRLAHTELVVHRPHLRQGARAARAARRQPLERLARDPAAARPRARTHRRLARAASRAPRGLRRGRRQRSHPRHGRPRLRRRHRARAGAQGQPACAAASSRSRCRRPPRGYHVSLCAKSRTLSRRTAAALWELAPATALV